MSATALKYLILFAFYAVAVVAYLSMAPVWLAITVAVILALAGAIVSQLVFKRLAGRQEILDDLESRARSHD
jgi:predicted signal transduction protein with EAL and GGDEF domain